MAGVGLANLRGTATHAGPTLRRTKLAIWPNDLSITTPSLHGVSINGVTIPIDAWACRRQFALIGNVARCPGIWRERRWADGRVSGCQVRTRLAVP